MRRNIAKFLGIALILGFAITAKFTVGAFSEGEGGDNPFGRPLEASDVKVRPRIDPEAVGELARFDRGKGDKDRNVRALEAKLFNRLSIGGKRIVLFRNGLLKSHNPSPSELQPENMQSNEVSPLINPGDNIRVNNPSIDDPNSHTQSESCAAANGPNVIVGFNDDAGDNFDGYGISTDGGSTFTHKRIPMLPGGANFGDPVVAFGLNPGEIYYSSLVVTESGKSIVGVAKSTNNGATFTMPVDASTTLGNTSDAQDKEWMVVDTNPNSPFKGNVYVSWTDFGFSRILNAGFIAFSRSTNGGATFEPPLALTPKIKGQFLVQGSMPVVASDGTLYIAFEDGTLNPDGISIIKSADGGKTFSTPKPVAAFATLELAGRFVTGGNSVRDNSFPSIAIDKNNPNNVYVVYDGVPTNSPMDRSDVFFARSTDGGNTFSAPRRLNDDNTTTTQLFPSIAVAADNTIGVRWWDRRNDPINDSLNDVYMTISNDGGNTFSKNFRITDHNWVFGPVELGLNAGYHGDYDQVAANGNTFYVPWSDERNSDPDIYFTVIPTNYNTNAPDFNVSAMKVFDSVIAGNSIDFDLSTSGTNSFSGSLSLSGSPAISGLSYNFASPTVTAGQSAKLTVSTTAAVQPGTYLITVMATGTGLARKTNFRLAVLDPNRPIPAGPPIDVTKTPGFTSAGSGLQIGPNGTMHLAFEDDTENILGDDVFYTQSVDGGKTYSTPIRVSTNADAAFSFDSALALDSAGSIYIVWSSENAALTGQTIFMSKSVDGGKSFSSPLALSPSSQIADFPGIAVNKSGKIVVAYTDFSPFPMAPVFAVSSSDGGASFSSPVMVSKPSESAVESTNFVAFDSKGAAYVIYENLLDLQQAVNAQINLAVAADGQNFTPAKTISDNRAHLPHFVIDNNDNIYVAFSELLGDTPQTFNFDVMFMKSTNKGGSFSQPQNLSNTPTFSLFPYVIVDTRGNVNVAWADRPDSLSQRDIFFARSTDGGSTFSQPTNLSGNSGASNGAFGAADADGNLFVAWTDDSTAETDIFISAVPAPAANPSDFSLAFNPAQVTVSRGQKGQFTVLINRTGGFSGNVTVTAPDTKAIKIKLTPPSQSTTGGSVSFSFKIKGAAQTGAKQLVFTGRDDSGRVRTATLTVVVQ